MSTIRKNKRFLVLFVVFLFTLGYFLHDLYRTKAAQAQACISIVPLFIPGTTTINSGGGCGSRTETINIAGSGSMVLMTGWRLRYTTSNDHHIDQIRANIQASGAINPGFVRFTVGVCVNDNNDDDDFVADVDWVVVRWL